LMDFLSSFYFLQYPFLFMLGFAFHGPINEIKNKLCAI